MPCRATFAQQDNPVYVDDSPQARELLRQAREQTRENAGEAVRVYQELLNEFPLRLVPASDAGGDQFATVRRRVNAALSADATLRDRYRLVQTPAAEQLLQQGALDKVAMCYTLTEPGIEAMLRLAQRELENGRFHAALAWLEQAEAHPDFVGRRAAHGRFMAALALHDLGEDHAAAAQRAALQDLGPEAAAFAQELDGLVHAARPAIESGASVLDVAPAPSLSDVVPQAIWSIPLDDSLMRRRSRAVQENEDPGALNNNAMLDRARDADLATAAVTVAGPTAYINEGHTILAIDRLTGRPSWTYQDLGRMAMVGGNTLDALDMNIVVTDGDSLVSLTGHAQPNQRSDGGCVVCLNLSDGLQRERWHSRLTGIIETAADEALFPHGAPMILEGRVFVLARKVTTQLITSAYVIALDLNDGHVLWWRHIAASGGLRIAARPFDSLISHDGALYVASPVGAAARLDPATGETRWLRRFSVPINPLVADGTRRPWEMTAPVICNRGLVTVQPDGRRVVLLDLDSGDELANHSASSSGDWNSPRYLLSDGPHVFAIGSDIRGFNADNLEAPVWRIPGSAAAAQSEVQAAPDGAGSQPPSSTLPRQPNIPPALESLDLRGRVQLAGEHIIAPTLQGLLIIDAATGAIEQTLPIDAAGNPLAFESQVLLAAGDRLDAYMSLQRAEEMLRRQMAQSPDSPDPALSLLRLGMRAGNVTLALEAADRAMKATEAHADDPAFDARRANSRAELFALLLELARPASRIDLTPEQGEAVFARLQQSAAGPEQRVDYLLAYGDWLASRAMPRAVETWQTILSDPHLASAWMLDDGVARPAWTRAVERIGRLVATRGASAYAPQSDFAALRLAQMREAAGAGGGSGPDPDALLALAREFPFAPAALDAAIAAADIRVQRGDARGGMISLLQAYLAAPRKESASQLLGRFADLAEQAGWRAQARDALESARAAFGDIDLQGAGGPQRISERVTALTVSTAAIRLPRIGLLEGQAVPLGAPVIKPSIFMAGHMPADRALLRDGNTIKFISAQKIDPAWTATVEGSSPQIIRFDDQAIILWFGGDPDDPKAVRLNPADGSVVWTSAPGKLREALGNAGPVNVDRLRVVRDQMPNGESFDPAETLALATAHGESIILVHRGGAMAALSATDGKTILWSHAPILQQVHFAALRDGVLVLAGMTRDLEAGQAKAVPGVRDRAGADAQQASAGWAPRVLVVDPDTGRPAFSGDGIIHPSGRAGIKWMIVSPLCALVYGTAEGLEAFDLWTGERLWANGNYPALDSQKGWCAQRRVVFQDQRNRLRSVRFADGIISDPFELPLRGEWDQVELRDLLVAGDSVIGHYRGRVVTYDPESGRVTGADTITDEHDFRWLVPAEDRLVAVSYSSQQTAIGAGAGGNPQPIRRTQYAYKIYPLSLNGKALAPPQIPGEALPERVQQVTAMDNWLLLSTLTDTLAVPMPAK